MFRPYCIVRLSWALPCTYAPAKAPLPGPSKASRCSENPEFTACPSMVPIRRCSHHVESSWRVCQVDPRSGEILKCDVIMGDSWVKSYLDELEAIVVCKPSPKRCGKASGRCCAYMMRWYGSAVKLNLSSEGEATGSPSSSNANGSRYSCMSTCPDGVGELHQLPQQDTIGVGAHAARARRAWKNPTAQDGGWPTLRYSGDDMWRCGRHVRKCMKTYENV